MTLILQLLDARKVLVIIRTSLDPSFEVYKFKEFLQKLLTN